MACTDDFLSWMRYNRLKLNAVKTELIGGQPQGGFNVFRPPQSGLDLRSFHPHFTVGCWLLSCSLSDHIVRRSLLSTMLEMLVVALVWSRLDYGNATYGRHRCRRVSPFAMHYEWSGEHLRAHHSLVHTCFMRPREFSSNWWCCVFAVFCYLLNSSTGYQTALFTVLLVSSRRCLHSPKFLLFVRHVW